MRAALLKGYNQPFDIVEVETPKPGPGEILIRVAGAGACHSDLAIAKGQIPIIHKFPVILGHENAGYIEDVGLGVEEFEKDQPVAIFGAWGCGACRFCIIGEEQACDESQWIGHGPKGGYAEFVVVPDARHLIKLDTLDPIVAAVLTDAGLTSYRAVRRSKDLLTPGSTAVLIGVGGLGHFGLQFLKVLGNSKVVAVDKSETARNLAESLGADVVLNPDKIDITAEIQSLTNGEGATVVVDFVGSDLTLNLAKQLVGRMSLIMIVGLARGTLHYSFLDLPAEVDVKTVSWGNIQELRQVIELVNQERVTPEIHRFPLEEINHVFELLECGEITGRAVLIPT